MNVKDLEYKNFPTLLDKYSGKGRRESASFLNWFLENIYRLDSVTADDAICDEQNDKGIDGIYVDHNAEEIHFFQSKISQKESSIGDGAIKQFVGSVLQFDSPEKIANVLAGGANPELKKILERNEIGNLVKRGYKIKQIFIANTERDHNTVEVEKIFPDLVVYAASDISKSFIEFDANEGVLGSFKFDTSYAGVIELSVEKDVQVYILPVSATDLVKLDGISDGTLFSQNVRYSLGNTPVNTAISKSTADVNEHKNFALYHNGVTLICKGVVFDQEANSLEITNYVVVNGAQSITTFYHNAAKLSNDLRVFLKIVSLQSDALARKITINSNNQNAIKPRDLRSNHDLMLRLKAEFDDAKCGYQFEIKRGQPLVDGVPVISNEDAGRALLAFDLDEPYSCHQIYRVFDDRYADIFGRREVTFGRIIFLEQLRGIVEDGLSKLDNKPMAKYTLTKYLLISTLGNIIRLFDDGRMFLSNIDKMNSEAERANILKFCQEIVEGLVVDLNYEVVEAGIGFDYKKDFKSPESVKQWKLKLLRTYEKDFKRKKAAGFGAEINREIL